jgi:hypothetical protein
MASGIYNRCKANLFNKEMDLEADTIKCALMGAGHAFTATHNTWSQVSGNEIADDSGNGYTAGGAALAGKAVTQAATTKWDANDTEWTNASFTASHAVLYDDTLAGDDLILTIDFGGAKTVAAGTFKLVWDTDGIMTLTS